MVIFAFAGEVLEVTNQEGLKVFHLVLLKHRMHSLDMRTDSHVPSQYRKGSLLSAGLTLLGHPLGISAGDDRMKKLISLLLHVDSPPPHLKSYFSFFIFTFFR